MRKNFRLKPQASRDIKQILRYIGSENLQAAEHMRERFNEAFALLGKNPGAGSTREDLSDKPVLFWAVHPNYMIVYDGTPRPIEILRVYHTARDFSKLMH